MSKNCTPLWREAHFQVKMLKSEGPGALFEVLMSNVLSSVFCRTISQIVS